MSLFLPFHLKKQGRHFHSRQLFIYLFIYLFSECQIVWSERKDKDVFSNLALVWDWMWLCVTKVNATAVCSSLGFLAEPYYRVMAQLQGSHVHVHDIMHGNIYWYSWPIFFPLQMNADTDTQTHSLRLLPLFSSDYIHHPECTNGDGTNVPLRHQCKLRERRRPPRNTGEKFLKMWVGPHSPHCYRLSWTLALCAADRREGPCYHTHKHTNMHQHTHLYVGANISHSLAAACTTIQLNFLPWHTHARTHTTKLIDRFTKNQLGAGYVRALRATERSEQ